jgi:hypothetical protein
VCKKITTAISIDRTQRQPGDLRLRHNGLLASKSLVSAGIILASAAAIQINAFSDDGSLWSGKQPSLACGTA